MSEAERSEGSAGVAEPEIVELPVIPLRGLTLFPKGLVPLTVARPASVRALEAVGDSRRIIVACQRDPQVESPVLSDLYPVGTIAVVLRTSAMPKNESVLVAFVEGQHRVGLMDEIQREPLLRVRGRVLADIATAPARELAGLDRSIRDLFHEIVTDSPNLPDELLTLADKVTEPSALADFVAQSLPSLAAETRQRLLEELDVRARMRRLMEELVRIREEQQLGQKLRAEVQEKITERQRELVLREQLKAIRRELGEEDEGEREIAELRARLAEAELPEQAAEVAERELSRLERMPAMSPEITVGRTYLEWLADLPWRRSSGAAVDLGRAARILDEDHYGLEKIKERILEYLAVFELKQDLKAPILCLVGAPGVGKTSVGKSIARAMGRKFVRISVGGMHDEAELRGHRRTYIGAMPGQIIQSLRRTGVNDPVFMLDEVDKLGRDFRGDPASALLEVLDPEQNSMFRDRYLDVPFDLSRILFLTTANYLDPIPAPLLDRMEILELPGYVDEEKLEIARRYLIPRQVADHGLELGAQIAFDEAAVVEIIRRYTREAGVRLLQQKIAAICRKRAKQVAAGDGGGRLVVTPEFVHEALGAPRFRAEVEIEERTRRPGVAVALAWTPAGGEILFVEASRMARGRGEFSITGQVRPVMQESAQAARSWVRANLEEYGCDPGDFRRYDVHVHIPAGAVPKDGPSAGIVMVVALASLFLNRPIRPHLAMTGEITLSGLVLPVGGIKEKVLAAKRSGVAEIILPEQNRPDVFEDIPAHLREGLRFHFVRTIAEALALALQGMRPETTGPQPSAWELPSPPIA